MRRLQQVAVVLLPQVVEFLQLLPASDRNEFESEFALVQASSIYGSRFYQTEIPYLWEITIPGNGHNWCILAYAEERFRSIRTLICTHFFQRKGRIPQREFDKALHLYSLYTKI